MCLGVQKLVSPYSHSGTPKHFGPIVLEREGAGEEAAWRGVGFFFCLGKRWSREPRPGTFPFQPSNLSVLTSKALGRLSFPTHPNIQNYPESFYPPSTSGQTPGKSSRRGPFCRGGRPQPGRKSTPTASSLTFTPGLYSPTPSSPHLQADANAKRLARPLTSCRLSLSLFLFFPPGSTPTF